MIRFFKDHAKVISKLYANQAGLTMFGWMMALTAAGISQKNDGGYQWIGIAGGILAILLYWYLLYNVCWEEGAQDKIRTEAGRAKRSPIKGLLIGLCAQTLNLALCFLTSVAWLLRFGIGIEATSGFYSVCHLLFHIVNGMFFGVVGAIATASPLTQLCVIAANVAVCALTYLSGLAGHPFLYIKTKNEENK